MFATKKYKVSNYANLSCWNLRALCYFCFLVDVSILPWMFLFCVGFYAYHHNFWTSDYRSRYDCHLRKPVTYSFQPPPLESQCVVFLFSRVSFYFAMDVSISPWMFLFRRGLSCVFLFVLQRFFIVPWLLCQWTTEVDLSITFENKLPESSNLWGSNLRVLHSL